METYFNIRYEFDKEQVHAYIASRLNEPGSDYICVADGNILANAYNDTNYRNIINSGMFSISDSSWVPFFIKCIYGINREHYTGSDIFRDIIAKGKYSMAFLGGTQESLNGLQRFFSEKSYPKETRFIELPFRDVEEFDYESIATELNDNLCDIIWIGLGAPKQEKFMMKLKPFLKHGIMIGVGAVFNFYGNTKVKRAPSFLRMLHLEFLHRIMTEPKKQIPKFKNYLRVIPSIIHAEYKAKNQNRLNAEKSK